MFINDCLLMYGTISIQCIMWRHIEVGEVGE